MGGDWLLGVAFDMTATAAASLDLSVRQVSPIGLPNGIFAIPPDAEAATSALRAVLTAAQFTRSGQPPSGLVLAYPDQWSPQHAGVLVQAAATLGYSANLVRLIPISAAAAHNPMSYPGDSPTSAAARGALLAVTGPVAGQIPNYSAPRPPAPRTAWIWAAVLAVIVVIAAATTTAVIVMTRGDETADAATATTPSVTRHPHTSAPATTPGPTTVGGNQPPPAVTVPPQASRPPEIGTHSTEPPPSTTVQVAPTTTKPQPTKPTTSQSLPPTVDVREASIRGYCQGFLNQVDSFPGGLPAMRAQVPPPLFVPPDEWAEAFDRAATGSCQ